MTKMHIAFLTPEYPHAKVTMAAGIGTTVKNLVTALVNERVSVSVFIYGQKTPEIFVEDGVKIHLIPNQKKQFFTWYTYRKYLQNYLNEYVLLDEIDLIEAPDWTGITAFMRLDVPLVIRFHGTDAYFCHLEKRRQKFKNFIFEKWGLRRAAAYIAPTDFAGKVTQDIFRIKGKLIHTIHSGISLTQFHNPNPKTFENGLILYVGTLIRKKGVLELGQIFERVLDQCPKAQLILIGSDSYDLKTKSDSTWLILQNTLNGKLFSKVKYLGKVPYQQVQDYIQKANVCVFPSFAETQGMVTIESMAMQKAVVNSNIGWANEIIADGIDGFLVHPKNHDLFGQRIIELIKNPDLTATIGVKAREKVVENFDIYTIVTKNIACYQSVLMQKR